MAPRQETSYKKPLVFLSYKAEDAALAQSLQAWLEENLLEGACFFAFSDHESLPLGDRWFERIQRNLDEAAMMLVLVTHAKFSSGWVFFEAGAAAARNIPLIPICIRAKLTDLPSPLNQYQAVDLNASEGPMALLGRVATLANLRPPKSASDVPLRARMEEHKTLSSFPEELHHVSLSVSKLDRSVKFYRDKVGLRETFRPQFKYAGKVFDGAWFILPSGQHIHLVSFPEGATANPNSEDYRNNHFALRVGDIEEAVERLRRAGVEIHDKSSSMKRPPQVYFLDPDGNLIELNEKSDLLP